MSTYFHGWRRKFGVVMLVMATVFACGWLRSFYVTDMIIFPTATALTSWISDQQGLAWLVEVQTDEEHKALMYDIDVPFIVSPIFFQTSPDGWNMKWSFCGFVYFNGDRPELTDTGQFIPHWSIVIPLTLLSVYLLLSKPRSPTPKKRDEPTSEKVARIMGDFFQGWRRKVAVITLPMACALLSGFRISSLSSR